MLDVISWCVSGISVVGAVLNAKQKISGFVFWCVANVAWVVIDCSVGLYAQAALFGVYTGISLYGIWTWWRKKKCEESVKST